MLLVRIVRFTEDSVYSTILLHCITCLFSTFDIDGSRQVRGVARLDVSLPYTVGLTQTRQI
jgi:hypothetical protein